MVRFWTTVTFSNDPHMFLQKYQNSFRISFNYRLKKSEKIVIPGFYLYTAQL